MEPGAHHGGDSGAGCRSGAAFPGSLSAAGGHRRGARAGALFRADRLAADRGPVRRAGPSLAVTGDRGEPGGRCGPRRRPAGRLAILAPVLASGELGGYGPLHTAHADLLDRADRAARPPPPGPVRSRPPATARCAKHSNAGWQAGTSKNGPIPDRRPAVTEVCRPRSISGPLHRRTGESGSQQAPDGTAARSPEVGT